jgi:chloramphenicol-sensitive protein RarD
VETTLLAPVAAGYLLWLHQRGLGALGHVDLRIHVLVLSTGVLTTVPLLLFALGARSLRLTTIGVLSYLGPMCQFALGRFVYDEPFGGAQLASFALIWSALIVYTLDALWHQHQTGTRPRSTPAAALSGTES